MIRSIWVQGNLTANRTATLYIRVTTADGKRLYCKAVYRSKGRLKPQYAMVNGETEHHKDGDLIDFMGWLRKQPPKLRKDGTPRKSRRSGDANRTYFNKVNNVVIFLSAHGINRLLKKSEYPKFAEKPSRKTNRRI